MPCFTFHHGLNIFESIKSDSWMLFLDNVEGGCVRHNSRIRGRGWADISHLRLGNTLIILEKVDVIGLKSLALLPECFFTLC